MTGLRRSGSSAIARVCTALLAVALVLGAAAPANPAPTWDLGNTSLADARNLNAKSSGAVHNLGLDKCMDDYAYNIQNGAAVVSYRCNGATNQNWTFNPNREYSGDLGFSGSLTLDNSPGKCLDIPNPNGDGTGVTNGTKLQIWDCNGGRNQQWLMQFATNGSTRIYNPMSYRCIDVPNADTTDGTALALFTCNGTPAQWFAPPAGAVPPSGAISNPELGGKCVDDPYNSRTAGTRVQSTRCNGTPAQLWSLNQDGSLTHGGLCLDIVGGEGAVANGTPIELWHCNSGLNQQWVVRFDAAGRTTLLNPGSGRCLDVPWASTADGTNLELVNCNDSIAQVWNAPRRPHPSVTGPVVAAPVVYPAGTGELFKRIDAMKDAEAKRQARAHMATALHGGGAQMRTEAGAALARNDADLSAVWGVWNDRNWPTDPSGALSKDVASALVADQARGQRDDGRRRFLDGFSMYDAQPDLDGSVINYMSSDSTFWRALHATGFTLPMPQADQAAKDRVTAIAKENGARNPSEAWLWDTYIYPTTHGSADDVRRFIQYNGYPTTAPTTGTPEFRIEVEAIKARWASGDPTNPFDPKYVLMDAEETAWAEYQAELNSQAQQRADITTAETQALEALKTGSEAMNDALSYAWYADRLLWAQQYRATPDWHADVDRIPHDLGVIKAKVAGLAEAAKMAAGQAQDAAGRVQAAQEAAAAVAKAGGTPEGRGLTYALQSAQVTKASASATTAVANAIQTALATTDATLADSATLLATAKAQAHAARAQFLRELAQGDARLAASLATESQNRANAAAEAAQQAATAKAKAKAAEAAASNAAAAAHESAATAAKERQNAATAKVAADAQRAKAQQAEAKAQQQAATAVKLRNDAQGSATTAAANDKAAQQAEATAAAARSTADGDAAAGNQAAAKADAAAAEAAAAVGTSNAEAARAAADRAAADYKGARNAAYQSDVNAGIAEIDAQKARTAANASSSAAARAKAAADQTDADTATTAAAALDAHAAAAEAIEASNQASINSQAAQTAADQAAQTAADAQTNAAAARSEADGAVAESAVAAGKAAAASEAAQQASAAAATVAAPADKAIDMASPYASNDSAAGLATLASQAAKTMAQQQAAVATARAAQAAEAALAAQQAADKADGEAKLAAQAAADAAKSSAAAAKSAADAMKSAASATADSAAAVQAATHSDQLVLQAKADQSAAHQSAKDASSDAAAAAQSATAAEKNAAGARKAATTAGSAAADAQQAANTANASATSAENAVERAKQQVAAAQEAVNRAGYEPAGAQGWCSPGSNTVCAGSTQTATSTGTPGSRSCVSEQEQYGCDMTAKLAPDWTQAFYRAFPKEKFGDCLTADFGNVDCQPAMFLQSAVIAAAKAQVDPRMVLSIALVESRKERDKVRASGLPYYLSYELAVIYTSAMGICPGHANDGTCTLGITNIKPVTWNYLAETYPNKFRPDGWGEVGLSTDKAMEAAAYYVKYLEATEIPKLPEASRQKYTPYQLLYGFYNGGIDPTSKSYKAFYDPTGHYGSFGTDVTGAIGAWEPFWDQSNQLICGSGILTCNFS
ncbi:ricin-type beta-trefoil lectin domain protein [Kitasatospora sp. NPDC048239]|uniref:ricin-type beta-trefoil lectin domain protein n=1 Tax=Kitasatospora sp. NPDC048239 TaxID=3364046 RepID=UPI0037245766